MRKKSVATIFLFFSWLISLVVISCSPQPNVLVVSGSSSMYKLFQEINNNYDYANLVMSVNGSSAGIDAVMNGRADFGNVSHAIDLNSLQLSNRERYENWRKKRIKTITVAWDPIFILYKKTHQEQSLTVDSSNIGELYKAFAGISPVYYSDFFDTDVNAGQHRVYAYARTGGAANSGTAAAFLEESGLISWNSSSPTQEEIHSLLWSGSYRGNYVVTTAEPNVQAWYAIANSNKRYALVYLSASFVIQNWLLIKKKFGIMKYKNINGALVDPEAMLNSNDDSKLISAGYGWYRPFNTIFRLPVWTDEVNKGWTFKQKKIIQLAYFLATGGFLHLYDDKRDLDKKKMWNKILDSSSVFSISSSQINEMFKYRVMNFKNFFISDFELGYAGVQKQI